MEINNDLSRLRHVLLDLLLWIVFFNIVAVSTLLLFDFTYYLLWRQGGAVRLWGLIARGLRMKLVRLGHVLHVTAQQVHHALLSLLNLDNRPLLNQQAGDVLDFEIIIVIHDAFVCDLLLFWASLFLFFVSPIVSPRRISFTRKSLGGILLTVKGWNDDIMLAHCRVWIGFLDQRRWWLDVFFRTFLVVSKWSLVNVSQIIAVLRVFTFIL